MKTFMMTSAAALLVAGTAFAQSDWDANADGKIDREEFRAGMSQNENVFGTWDADGDGVLSREEYDAGVAAQDDADTYGSWDERFGERELADPDRMTAEEYTEGLWTAFDTDADDLWSDEEAAAWESDAMRYDATRSGREVSQ